MSVLFVCWRGGGSGGDVVNVYKYRGDVIRKEWCDNG